jgi:hypothetical protein
MLNKIVIQSYPIDCNRYRYVIPAKAGIQVLVFWTSAFAGETVSLHVITPAVKYLKVVIPAEAGIQKTLDAGSSPA